MFSAVLQGLSELNIFRVPICHPCVKLLVDFSAIWPSLFRSLGRLGFDSLLGSHSWGSLECIHLIFNVFLFHLSWRWTGNLDKIIQMISSVSSGLFWLDLHKDWHLIRKLNSFLNADISPGFLIGDMCLVFILYAAKSL